MTPKLVSLKYSKGLDLLVVLRKGYKYKGIWAEKENRILERVLKISSNRQNKRIKSLKKNNSINKYANHKR